MLRLVFILVFIDTCRMCHGDTIQTDDWKKQGFYRPRRNYFQNQNSFQHNYTQNSLNQNSFGSRVTSQNFSQKPLQTSLGQNRQSRNIFGTNSQNSQGQNSFSRQNTFETNYRQNTQSQNAFGFGNSFNQKASQSPFESYNANFQRRSAFGTSPNRGQNSFASQSQNVQSQNSFGTSFGQKPSAQNSFGSSNQNSQNQNAFGSFYNKPLINQNYFGTNNQNSQNQFGASFSQNSQRQNSFGSSFSQSVGSGNLYLPNSASNSPFFKGPDYLPPKKGATPYRGPEYLPPKDSRKTTTKRPFCNTSFCTTIPPFFTYSTTTKRTTNKPTTTEKPTTTTYTKGPDLIPEYELNVGPAMAILVPPEPEDEPPTTSTTTTKAPSTLQETPPPTIPPTTSPSTTTSSTTTTKILPTPEETPPMPTMTTTTSTTPDPNRNLIVETVVTTTPSMTPSVITTPSTTEKQTVPPTTTTKIVTTTPPTTEQTVPPTTTRKIKTTPTIEFIGPEYLPPKNTTHRDPPPGHALPAMAIPVPPEPEDDLEEIRTTAPPATERTVPPPLIDRSKEPEPAPAMAMFVPPEPEDEPKETTTTPQPTTVKRTVPPTTTRKIENTTPPTTVPPTTTKKIVTTPPPTTEPTAPPTTTTRKIVTTPPPTTEPTAPKTTTTRKIVTTPPPTTEPIVPPTTTTRIIETTPPPTTEPAVSPTTTTTRKISTTPSIDRFKGPEYLPPKKTTGDPPPKPANAMPVPPEPEEEPKESTTTPPPITSPFDVDQRNFEDNRCVPTFTSSTTGNTIFVGPSYLPPVAKTRVKRSAMTLNLGQLTGIPRPVWHVGLYEKWTSPPYRHFCGGSIVRVDVVISAAHCFWVDGGLRRDANLFAVAANKIYKRWDVPHPHDKRAQKSDVAEIIIPPRYRGEKTSYQDDIAILKLATPFTYARGLRPICISFDEDLETRQLVNGYNGTVAGWGLTDEDGTPTQELLWLELAYVEIEQCIEGVRDDFVKYITSDKICAGENATGKALCRGDSGGGLAFWYGERDHVVPYLRGIASTSARDTRVQCNVHAVPTFTEISAHRRFLLRHLPGIDQECQRTEHYPKGTWGTKPNPAG